MNYIQDLTENQTVFFNFMKEKYPVYYNSNIFFRDIQYSIKYYYQSKGITLTYPEAENICKEYLEVLVQKGELAKIDNKSFKVNFKLEVSVLE